MIDVAHIAVLDSYVETTKYWMPGTDHGHRFVITVHGYASETNVLIIYSSQPVGVWLLRSFLRMESHLWEMFVLSQVASCLLIYMFWIFFFAILFSLISKQLRFTPTTLTFPFFKAYFKSMVGPATSQDKENDTLLAIDNYTQVGNKAALPKPWSIDHRRKSLQCRRL